MREQFFQAVRDLEAGRHDAAAAQCRELLDQHPDHPDLLQLLGATLCESGALEEGLDCLSRAVRASDGNPEAWYNLGSAQLRAGLAAEALESLDRALALVPDHPFALNNRGNALVQLERSEEAAAAYSQVIALQPQHAGAIYNLASIQLDQGASAEAEAGFRKALSLVPDHAGAVLGLATVLLGTGRAGEAVAGLEALARTDPGNAECWSTLGRALNATDHYEQGLNAHRKASELEPKNADHWNNIGSTLTTLERLDEAETALKCALVLEPEHHQACGNLAALYELANRLEDCERVVQEGLSRQPSDPGLRLARAKLHCHRGELEEARTQLQTLREEDLPPPLDKDVRFNLAQVLDRDGDAEAAYAVFEEANQCSLQWYQASHGGTDPLLPALDEMQRRLDGGWARDWAVDPAGPETPPAFLFGFQRSGTTLIDTMLGAHGGVHVMEEQPVLNRVIERLGRQWGEQIGEYPGAVARLNDEQLADLRQHYFQSANDLTGWDPGSGLRLLDKSPLGTVHLGLIRRLFPDAPLVLALRHPCDVVLSCFMQDFTLTPFMTHYTHLEGVARVYDRVMGLWKAYRKALDPPHLVLRYEDLVEETEGELRRLLEALGLPWRDEVLDHTTHARQRGLINTPSYHQVTQPVYQSARFRWHRYRDPLEPVLPILRPWIEYFGYQE